MRNWLIISSVISVVLTQVVTNASSNEKSCRARLRLDACTQRREAMPLWRQWFYNITEERCRMKDGFCWEGDNSFYSKTACEEKCQGVKVPVCPAEMVDGVVDPDDIAVLVEGYFGLLELPSNESYFNQTLILPHPVYLSYPVNLIYTIISAEKPLIKSVHFEIKGSQIYSIYTVDGDTPHQEVSLKVENPQTTTPISLLLPSYPADKVMIGTRRDTRSQHVVVSRVTIAACYAPVSEITTTMID